MDDKRIGTGIEGLDRAIDGLRSGDTVLWQIAHIRDYIFAATQFVAHTARDGQRIVYLRFGTHDEVIDAQALAERGANVKKYTLDPTVGFETFSVQVHRIIKSEPEDAFYLFDCLSDLQKFWFSDSMVCNFFCLTAEFLRKRRAIAYIPLRYERHTYETISRIRIEYKRQTRLGEWLTPMTKEENGIVYISLCADGEPHVNIEITK